jgi:hypothetical protein
MDGFLAIHEALTQYRGADPALPCVCNVTNINYGTRPNVIGDRLSFQGCFRGFTQEDANLFRDRLHWLEFTCYLSGLPEGSRYCDILGIRARPMPNPTKYNAEERQWLMKAKAEYALQMTDKEQREQYARNVGNLASVLIAWANMGGEEDG